MVATAFDEERALRYNAFDGDFGSGEVTLSNKFVTGRCEHECHHCAGVITKGERHRVQTDRVDGGLETYRFCQACCAAMAHYELTGEDDPIESRVQMYAK